MSLKRKSYMMRMKESSKSAIHNVTWARQITINITWPEPGNTNSWASSYSMAGSSIQTWCFYIINTTRVGYSTRSDHTRCPPWLSPIPVRKVKISGGHLVTLVLGVGCGLAEVGGGDVDTDSDEDRVYGDLVDGPGISSGRTLRRPKWAG